MISIWKKVLKSALGMAISLIVLLLLGISAKAECTYTYESMQQDIAVLTAQYPNILTCEVIGDTAQGRHLYMLTMGNKNASHNVFISASMHATEYQNTQLVMDIVKNELANWADKDICYYIVPMVNPDGINISQNKIYEAWVGNAGCVDLNRNFPWGWYYTAPGTAESFHGMTAASELETKAMLNVLLVRKYDCTVSYHQQGQVIYYYSTGMKDTTFYKAKQLTNLVKAVTGYKPVKCGPPNGGMGDYINTVLDTPNVTIETGTITRGRSDYSKIYKQNINILRAVENYIALGF